MWSFLATIMSALIGIFVKSKPNPVAEANHMNAVSSEAARQTETQTEKELADAQAETDKSLAAVQSAGSLRDIALASQRAIDAANHQPGADD